MALLWVALAFVLGAVAGDLLAARGLFGCGWPGWVWVALLPLLPASALLRRWEREPEAPLVWPRAAGFRAPRTRPSPALIAACAIAAALGLARMAAQPLAPCWTTADLALYNEPAARAFDGAAPRRTVEGYIASYISVAGGRQRITVQAQRVDGRPVSGALTLTVADTGELTYGQPVRVRGILATPPDFRDFSYRTYLARHSIHSQMTLARIDPTPGARQGRPLLRALYAVRARGELLIQRSLPEPYAALASGILLGIDTSIPDDIQQQFNDTSATHVLVISGANVALIAGVLLALSGRAAGRRAGFVFALVGIGLYALLVGGEPSVLRAALMGALVVLATRLNRSATALVSLALATLVMALFNAHILWDVGFQLSALATAGLILLAPPLGRGLGSMVRAQSLHGPARGAAEAAAGSLAVTLAASLAVLPLLLYTFQRLSVVGLVTNLLIVPVQPLILLAGSAALAAGLAGLLPVAQGLFWAAWLGLAWTLAIVQATAATRWASVAVGGFGLPALLACYILLGVLLWQAQPRPLWQVRRRSQPDAWVRRLASPAVTGALLVAAALVWLGVRTLPDGRLHVYLLPVERGMGAFVQTPSGRQILVDGGDDAAALLTELGTVMPFWDRTLDLMVLTGADARAAGTQAALPARLSIGAALRPGGDDERLAVWERGLVASGVPVSTTAAGGWVEVGDGAALWIAGADDALTIKVVYGEFGALLVGEGTPPGSALPGATALVLREAEGAGAWLAAAAPALTIVYGGAPVQAATVRYPQTEGRIHLWTDGIRWWME